jgi:Arc/MetJ family transcription regulator
VSFSLLCTRQKSFHCPSTLCRPRNVKRSSPLLCRRFANTGSTVAKRRAIIWRTEHLFALKQALDAFDFIGTQVAECDGQIERQPQTLQAFEGEPAKGKKRGRARNAPRFDLRTQLFKMCGVDLTRIDGIDVTTALAVISETGADMSRFPTVAHFASWMGLCPGTKITGGKVMSGRTQRNANGAAQALRLAAAALRSSQSALGAYYRRMCSRMDKPKAVTAAAHKLARLIYTMLTKGEEYTNQGQAYYEERYRERVVRQLSQRANKLGMQLVAARSRLEVRLQDQAPGWCFLSGSTRRAVECVCEVQEIHMRTNIVIDDKLMADALKATGAKTKKEAVELGLRTLLQMSRQAEVRRLRGKVQWQGDLEAMRRDK